MVIYYQKTT